MVFLPVAEGYEHEHLRKHAHVRRTYMRYRTYNLNKYYAVEDMLVIVFRTGSAASGCLECHVSRVQANTITNTFRIQMFTTDYS